VLIAFTLTIVRYLIELTDDWLEVVNMRIYEF